MRVTEKMRLATTSDAQTRAGARLDKASRVAARGSRVASPSDDPVAYAAKVRSDHALSLIETRSELATKVSGELNVAESALSTGVDLLSRVRESAVAGANETLDPASRQLLAQQVKAIREEMIGIANTRFGTKYLFGGTKTDTPPFSSGTGAFTGNDIVTRVPLMEGVSPPTNVSGARAFTTAGGRDVLDDLKTLADALDANDVTTIRSSLDNIDSAHTQLVRAETEAGLASQRFSSAIDIIAGNRTVISAARAKEVDGDPFDQLTELSLSKAAYERGVEVTRQLLSLSSLTRQ